MSRKEIPAVGSYVHICNRGAKKMPIFRQKEDLSRLLINLFYLNSVGRMPENWMRQLERLGDPKELVWPSEWHTKAPLVSILAFSIMPNHFHLILKEIKEGGISTFMHRLTMGYAKFINEKYSESGSLFQGPFRSRIVSDDNDLRYLAVYVMVKNTFELFQGGLPEAIKHFDQAYVQAIESPLNSLAEYAGKRSSPIVTKEVLGEIFSDPEEFRSFANDCMLYQLEQLNFNPPIFL
ncbi:hypothetical protein A2671_01550 [Candidatus Kaiserbacteria bacterium RIFCSPHIGHO2_01_FULL_49_13]|uniref:Transposase IS200-like domain-containing protein n=1 Tax=Candidatus Kaiserbacteria bacterium RIFCSPHIGHO2_01_FULL_49_13 TaxID=1798477 RepID=A0A1F6CCY8_9BACT|nr:MAG: hypothetical protein A2671_01550 [Candidatus Kaiserbacteria bacterium RIFCSPHIGHO2_01_FULL_49_13]